MSRARPATTRLEAWGLLAASAAFTLWYAIPQLLFSLYPLYEMLRLLFPAWLPDFSPAAKELLEGLGLPG